MRVMFLFSRLSWLLLVAVAVPSFVLAEEVQEPELQNDKDIPVISGHGGDVKIATEDDVLILTANNFHFAVATKNPILVEFYAPWCGHCKSLAPEYAKAASKLKADGIEIAKVDATQESELGQEFGVTGYPTIKLFRGGKVEEDYDGGRTAQAIVEYMRRKADPNYVPPPTAVVELKPEELEAAVQAPLTLVQFYEPNCRGCKKLEPDYESAAQELKDYGILLTRVDVSKNKELATKYDATDYPALKVFRKGRVFEYRGGQRDSSSLISYMKDQQRAPSQEVRSLVNSKNAVLRTQPTVYGCFASQDEPLYEEFIAAANMLRGDIAFVHTFDSKVAAAHQVPAASVTIVMPEIYRSKFEDDVRTMPQSGSASAEAIVRWVTDNAVPLLGERTHDNQQFLYAHRPLLVVYGQVDFSHQHIAATQHLREKLLPLAHRHRGALQFALCNEEAYMSELETVGLGDSGEDVNAAIYTNTAKYGMEPDDDYVEELEEFVSKFLAGKLKPFLKSQPVPKRQSGPVKVLVARSFEKEVMQSNKDFLIEFYAPWCGHCKSLEPVYKQLAKELAKQEPNVVVAKLDGTSNDVDPLFKVEGFPTIYYSRAGDRAAPVKFEGSRTLEGLKEFVLEQRSAQSAKDEL